MTDFKLRIMLFAKAKEAGIEIDSYMGYIDDFSDEALDYLGKVKHRANGTTISDHGTGTKIHKGFMNNGGKNKGSSLRYDGLKNGGKIEFINLIEGKSTTNVIKKIENK